jgi:hypothetical protein
MAREIVEMTGNESIVPDMRSKLPGFGARDILHSTGKIADAHFAVGRELVSAPKRMGEGGDIWRQDYRDDAGSGSL